MAHQDMPGIDSNAVSLYGNSEALDEFPVLKAFQQYIDAEQEKSRKRMVSLSILFGVLMAGVVTVFVVLLVSMSKHNQTLNDRLVEFAMKERAKGEVADPAKPQDTAAFVSMFSRMDALQKQIEANQAKTEKAMAEANERALKAVTEAQSDKKASVKAPSRESEEIATLKALLQVEKDKLRTEREKLRQAELEVYRRQHYPECYATPQKKAPTAASKSKNVKKAELERLDAELENELNDDDAINYFDENEEAKPTKKAKIGRPAQTRAMNDDRPVLDNAEPKKVTVSASPKTEPETPKKIQQSPKEIQQSPKDSPQSPKGIQLNVSGKTSSWDIPND